MLTIRKDQVSAFERYARVSFEDRMVRHVERTYPADYVALGNTGTRELIRRTIAKASENHIKTEGAIAALLELFIEFGVDLELAPCRKWAFDIFAHPKLPGQLKLSIVRDRLSSMTQGRRIVRHQESE